MAVCPLLGWDWIPGHVTPLCAFLKVKPITVRHAIPPVSFAVFVLGLRYAWGRSSSPFLLGAALVGSSFALNVAVASMSDGVQAVGRPFTYYGLDYFTDVPFVRTPFQFLRDFSHLRPHFTMHARTHPPGPILILWVLSLLNDGNVLYVGLWTVLFGSMAALPLYWFVRDLTDERTALIAAGLWCVVPTTVLYGATSMNAVYAACSITSLWLFNRAMLRDAWRYGPLAGLAFGLTFFMSFDMGNLGIYCAVMFLLCAANAESRRTATVAAGLCVAAFAAFYSLLYVSTGYNVIVAMRDAVQQVRADLQLMDKLTPRASYWAWRFGNPFEVLFFAGVPTAALLISGLRHSIGNIKIIRENAMGMVIFAGLALMIVFNFTYLGKSEEARVSSFYLVFIIAPATLALRRVLDVTGTTGMLYATLGLMFIQTWLMETLLFTYW